MGNFHVDVDVIVDCPYVLSLTFHSVKMSINWPLCDNHNITWENLFFLA